MIQIIAYEEIKEYKSDRIYVSLLKSPKSLDEFDVCVIDLRNVYIWRSKDGEIKSVDCVNDLIHLKTMIINHRLAKILIIIPQNCEYNYNYGYSNSKWQYIKSVELKNILQVLEEIVFSKILSCKIQKLVYENTTTSVGTYSLNASFYFDDQTNAITISNKSKKTTTIYYDGIYLTTLNIPCKQEAIFDYLMNIGLFEQKEKAPDWFSSIKKLDDKELNESLIRVCEQINLLKEQQQAMNIKIEENNKCKSILFTNGEDLVIQVYRILEQLLDCDLSGFVDIKKEDFLIKKGEVTFIGEIKGINSNVKNANISQVDIHVQNYIDSLEETEEKQKVKGLLIVNYQRERSPETRDNINQAQIDLAVRNNSLIITTVTLLDLYEMFVREQVTSDFITNLFSEKSGLLRIEDLAIQQEK